MRRLEYPVDESRDGIEAGRFLQCRGYSRAGVPHGLSTAYLPEIS